MCRVFVCQQVGITWWKGNRGVRIGQGRGVPLANHIGSFRAEMFISVVPCFANNDQKFILYLH